MQYKTRKLEQPRKELTKQNTKLKEKFLRKIYILQDNATDYLNTLVVVVHCLMCLISHHYNLLHVLQLFILFFFTNCCMQNYCNLCHVLYNVLSSNILSMSLCSHVVKKSWLHDCEKFRFYKVYIVLQKELGKKEIYFFNENKTIKLDVWLTIKCCS